VLADGSILTPDLGGKSTTNEVVEAVLKHLWSVQ
jgi:homoisocitrate dehydrogenase